MLIISFNIERCEATKKPKQSFGEAWLSDNCYKLWVRRVPTDNSVYFCTIRNKSFSCTAAHIHSHAKSACNQAKLKANESPKNKNITAQNKITSESLFEKEWLDIDNYKVWLREIPGENICFCILCDKSISAHLSHICRHAE